MRAEILFSGKLIIKNVPPINNNSRPCAICGRPIAFDGIYISGEVMNPEMPDQRAAEWRLGTDTWLEGDLDLAKKKVLKTVPIDIFVDDVLCLASFFRNHLNSPFTI